MPMVIFKVELNLRWPKLCVLSVGSTDNVSGNKDYNNIIFTIKDTKLYIPVETLSTKDNQNLLAKDLKDQFTGMNAQQKMIIKIRQTNLDSSLNQILF